ncbi:MAG: barstar family protein [Prevotellaceae bacterium]|jgi:ribonuclease inhibitor|nr:barstar family protein [Prevotellaceae bacterium]
MEQVKIIEIDFKNITSCNDFYGQLKSKIKLPDYFGNNLDALYDVLTGYIRLPLILHFTNLNLNRIDDMFDLFNTFDDAAEATDYDFSYICTLDRDKLTVEDIEYL